MTPMIFRFGEHEIDTDVFEVRRLGRPVPVEPQVFDVLAYLVTHRDHVVGKEELLDQVWGDRFVSESALTSRVKSARRAVGDDGTAQRVIRTIHGRGYRFVAPVEGDPVAAWSADGSPNGADAAIPASAPSPAIGIGGERGTGERRAEELPDAPAPNIGRPTAWPLLGRSAELARLADWFEDEARGGALVTGGPGVGKSRLAEEVLRLVQARGGTVARAVGHPGARSLPLAALTHLLPPDVADAGPSGELDLGAVFHRARLALVERSSPERMLLWVDDVEHLDDLSLAVVASLVLSRGVFAVLTMRTPGEVPPVLRALVKDGHLETLVVSPLGAMVMDTLLHRVLGGPVEATTSRLLVETAQGNAGVLRQLVAASLEAQTLRGERGIWALSGPLTTGADLRELVRDRLRDLDDGERFGLELLAVASHLGLEVLIGLVGADEVEHLDDRGLLDVRVTGRRTDVSLSHPLFGEVLRGELPALRGRRLRQLAADALEGVGARRREDPIRITAWRLDAGGSVDPTTLSAAIRLALADGDLPLAGRLLERLDGGADPGTAALLRAEWHFRRGENLVVEELLASLPAPDLPAGTRAQVVRRRAANRFYWMGDFDGAIELIDRAVPTLTDLPRLTLEALRATLLALDGNVIRALELTADAAECPDPAIRLELLRARCVALALHSHGESALALVDDAFALAASLAPEVQAPGRSVLRFARLTALIELGRWGEAGRAVDEAQTDLAGVYSGWSCISAGRLALVLGDTPGLRRDLEQPIAKFAALGHGAIERWLLALVAQALVYEGDISAAGRALDRVSALQDQRDLRHNELDRAKAWLSLHHHGADAACELLLASADEAHRYGKHAFEVALLHDVVRMGRPRLVVDRLSVLSGQVEGPLVALWAAHARAAAGGQAHELAGVARTYERLGSALLAAEAWAQAATCGQADGELAEHARGRIAALGARYGTEWKTPPFSASPG
jgi:DNA-binding winged helix-turn-helix (wHTH) protein/tetratricopeptide (TPR) repeat protein